MLRVSPLSYKGETSLFKKDSFFFLVLSLSRVWCLGDSLGQSFSSPEQCLGVEVLLVRRCILGNRRRSDFSEHQGDGEYVLRRS